MLELLSDGDRVGHLELREIRNDEPGMNRWNMV